MTKTVNLNSIFFLIPTLVQVSCYLSSESRKCTGGTIIGTVLYTPSDVHKECWSPDEIAVLTTRMILEDLFPNSSKLNIDSNEYVDDLIEYFKTMIEVVRKTTNGRKKHVVLLALTDLIGGYFHHIILPIARHAYYAGYLDFTNMERLIQMYEELKWFLRTNGQGWSRPIANVPELEADAINLKTEKPMNGNKSCCSKLVYWEKEKPNKKCHKGKVGIDRLLHFPMPFFDSKNQPTAIVVPFKRYPVRNIESRKGAYLVMKFFVSGYQCLIDRNANKESVEMFQNNYYAWIIDDILPKLYDDKFYSSFGGVLRVVETLKALGATPVSHKVTTPNSCDEELEPGTIMKEPKATKKGNIVAMIMILIILIWFCIGTTFICYRTRRGGGSHKSDKGEKLPDYVKTCAAPCSISSERISSIFSKSSSSKKSSGRKSKSGSDATSSQFSSETEPKEKSKKRGATACYPPQRRGADDRPAVIEVKHTMKTLSSIEEISENSSRHDRNKKRISFEEPSVIMKPCPHHCSVKRKCSDCRCDPNTKKRPGIERESSLTSSPSTKGETTEDTEAVENLTCHSSLTADYMNKPNSKDDQLVFGYDFHTTSSSEMSEEEMDSKNSTSNSQHN